MGAIFVAVVGIPLEAASELGLSDAESSTWILIVWGFPGVLSMLFTARYRQPLVLTGNIFILLFVLLLGSELSWSELVGATMAAGFVVFMLGAAGVTHRLAAALPPPIVYGLLAGAVLGLFADSVTSIGTATLLVGSTFASYFLGRAVLGDRIPALLVALAVGLVVAVLASETGRMPDFAWPQVTLTVPSFTFEALVTVTPVLVVFIALQANAPSVVFLRSQGYEAPERAVSLVSGAATMVGSLFGPMGVSLSLPATALAAGPDAGDRDMRRVAANIAAGISILVASAAGFATDLIEFIPGALLDAIVGLAVLGVLAQSLREVTRGPLLLGPVVAFGTSVSNIVLLGLGRFFWAIVFGLGVSLLLERDAWGKLVATQMST